MLAIAKLTCCTMPKAITEPCNTKNTKVQATQKNITAAATGTTKIQLKKTEKFYTVTHTYTPI